MTAPRARGAPTPNVDGTPRRWRQWKASVLAAGAGSAYLFQVIPNLPPWAAWSTGIVGTALTAATVVVHHRQVADLDEVAQLARQEATVAIQGLIVPAAENFKLMAAELTADSRAIRMERLTQLLLDLASQIRPDARACFYLLTGSRPNRVLTLMSWRGGRGRRQSPRSQFVEGYKIVDDDMFRMIDEGSCRFEEDVTGFGSDWFVGPHEYGTYIAVPVAINDQHFGFLGVDVPLPRSLNDSDVDTVRILAGFLAAAITLGARRRAGGRHRMRHKPAPEHAV